MEYINARVVEILLDKYMVQNTANDSIIEAYLSGNLKRKKDILVGDNIEVKRSYDKYIIEKINARKNFLIRPPVANIDELVIVLSLNSPSPDYTLLDKELILCVQKNIKPVICINKIDLKKDDISLEKEIEYIKKVYGTLDVDILEISVKENKGIENLKDCLKGKVSAFSGNSGVGKSSITKAITLKDDNIEIGDIGVKTNKGKHTTKYVKIYKLEKDTYILDTPGFSSYELFDINYKELKKYYFEFSNCHCDYEDCAHVNENISVCDVKQKVEEKIIDVNRYNRYVYLYNELKEKDAKKYK